MKIKGIMTQEVQVDITHEECLHALCDSYGLAPVFYPPKDIMWEEIHDKDGKLVLLEEKRDMSYHGSSCYEKTGRFIKHVGILQAYEHLKWLLADGKKIKGNSMLNTAVGPTIIPCCLDD